MTDCRTGAFHAHDSQSLLHLRAVWQRLDIRLPLLRRLDELLRLLRMPGAFQSTSEYLALARLCGLAAQASQQHSWCYSGIGTRHPRWTRLPSKARTPKEVT